MSASRARKIMIAAIAISVLVHLLIAGYLRWPFAIPSNEPEVVRVRRLTIARVAPHTPAPTPVPTPRATAAPAKTKVIPPATTSRGTKGPPVARVVSPVSGNTPAPPATPAPMPSASPLAQACLARDISAALLATPDPAEIPADARASKVSGTAAIQVEIDTSGHVTDATVKQSSGNAGLDDVALQTAKSAAYSPALVKCKPVVSLYTFTMKFAAW